MSLALTDGEKLQKHHVSPQIFLLSLLCLARLSVPTSPTVVSYFEGVRRAVDTLCLGVTLRGIVSKHSTRAESDTSTRIWVCLVNEW